MAQNRLQKFSGGGVVLSNLFNGYPRSRLKFIHRDQLYNIEGRQGEYRVNWRWVRLNIPKVVANLYKLIRLSFKEGSLLRTSELRAVVQQSSHFFPPVEVMKEIDLFQPKVIYAWASDGFWAKSVIALARELDSPYVIHFMDNHLEKTAETKIEKVVFPQMKINIQELIFNAMRVFAISDSMASAYSKRFKCAVDVFRAAIDASEWPRPTRKIALGARLTIGYVGSIEESQTSSLMDLIEVASELNKTSTCRIEVVLYLTKNYKKSIEKMIKKRSFVSIVDHPNFSDLRSVLGALDLLVSFYGFDIDSISYYKYSFSTKIVPYMLSGTPILIYGPAEIEPVNYARLGDWSIIIDTRSKILLGEAIQKFIHRPQDTQRLVLRAWQSAVKNHDLKSNALRFQSVLQDVSLNRSAVDSADKLNE